MGTIQSIALLGISGLKVSLTNRGYGKDDVNLVMSDETRKKHFAVDNRETELGNALKSYELLELDYTHKVINHAEKYVDGQIHTNGIENFWSLLKRMLRGTYVSVEPFHLFRYLDEQSFRFNDRKGNDADRFGQVVKQITGKQGTSGKC